VASPNSSNTLEPAVDIHPNISTAQNTFALEVSGDLLNYGSEWAIHPAESHFGEVDGRFHVVHRARGVFHIYLVDFSGYIKDTVLNNAEEIATVNSTLDDGANSSGVKYDMISFDQTANLSSDILQKSITNNWEGEISSIFSNGVIMIGESLTKTGLLQILDISRNPILHLPQMVPLLKFSEGDGNSTTFQHYTMSKITPIAADMRIGVVILKVEEETSDEKSNYLHAFWI
jgi:hypothetical protein